MAVPAAFGGTGSSVTFAGVLTDEGSWRVVVTNAEGSAEATFDYRVFVDTDGDGLSDGYEALFSLTDPFDPDTDQDGLNDSSEVRELGTDPLLADTDGDGFDDGFEIRVGYDPVSAASSPDLLSEILIAIEFRFNAANGLSYCRPSNSLPIMIGGFVWKIQPLRGKEERGCGLFSNFCVAPRSLVPTNSLLAPGTWKKLRIS